MEQLFDFLSAHGMLRVVLKIDVELIVTLSAIPFASDRVLLPT